MNVAELISKNADIYDGLADHFNLDLAELKTPNALLEKIKFEIQSHESIMEACEEESTMWNIANRESATLHMIKGFIDTMLYRETEEYEEDEFYTSVFDIANDHYEAIAGKALPNHICQMFKDLEIRNTDDLSDDGGEFDELEYASFDHALNMLESFDR